MISKSSLMAIKALALLAQNPPAKWEGAGSIARKINAPENYLSKILQSLVTHGLVSSQKGSGGGFRLEKNPEELTLYEVVECLEDMEKWSKCFLGRLRCLDSDPCPMHHKWKELRDANIRFLQEMTLAGFNG